MHSAWFFQSANERISHDFRRACLLSRPSHAHHQLQSTFAALQSSLSSYILDSLACISFEHDLSTWIGGPETPAEWDALRPISPAVDASLAFITCHLPALALQARPIWTYRPMQLYACWLTHQLGTFYPASFFSVVGVAYVDAFIHSYGIAWGVHPDDHPVIIVAPPHPADPRDERAHHEASAYKQAAIFIASLGLQGRVIIISDCLPDSVAMAKGSSSEVLQAVAEDVVYVAVETSMLFEPLWVPCTELVEMEVDDYVA